MILNCISYVRFRCACERGESARTAQRCARAQGRHTSQQSSFVFKRRATSEVFVFGKRVKSIHEFLRFVCVVLERINHNTINQTTP